MIDGFLIGFAICAVVGLVAVQLIQALRGGR